MLNQQDRTALCEVLEHARALGDDEIALDCEAALKGDRDALLDVIATTRERRNYAAWRPV